MPPNNWDSLTYHLTRVAGWRQEHGVHWIANAPTGRINEFQPLAEQLILFLVVAGSTALYALPQYVAELAILISVYGAARRLGYEPRAAARGTALVAMLSLVALESTTAQNDLVAASFPIAAAFFLLGRSQLEIGAEKFLGNFVVERLMRVMTFFEESSHRHGDLFRIRFCLGWPGRQQGEGNEGDGDQ